MSKKKNKKPKEICDSCGQEVLINLGLYDETGLCGTCCMGEAELSYTDEYPRGSIK